MVDNSVEQATALADFELAQLRATEKRRRAQRRVLAFSGPFVILAPFLFSNALNASSRGDVGVWDFSFAVAFLVAYAYSLKDLWFVVRRQFEDTADVRDRLVMLERKLAERISA